jgi:hypothetical protein
MAIISTAARSATVSMNWRKSHQCVLRNPRRTLSAINPHGAG